VTASLLLASNRGPVSYAEDGRGGLVARRGAGGLVSAVVGALSEGRALWVCAALSAADRLAARDAGGRVQTGVEMLDVDPVTFDRAYNGVANSTLWFGLAPAVRHRVGAVFDARTTREWAAYRQYDDAFAEALARNAAPGATVLVQDYHLALTPRQLRERRPDVRIGHFSHTPWAPPEYFCLLPDEVAREVLLGMLGADAVGFHSAAGRTPSAAAASRCSGRRGPTGRCGTRGARRGCRCTRSGSTPTSCAPSRPRRRCRDGCRCCASWSATASWCCGSTAPS
jgi:trehalose 6-phosphate synthase